MLPLLHRRVVSWITLLAVVFAVVSPAVAASRYLADPVSFAAVCSLDNAGSGVESQGGPVRKSSGHGVQCVFCISAAPQLPVENSLAAVAAPGFSLVLHVASGRDDVRPADRSSIQPLSPRAPPGIR